MTVVEAEQSAIRQALARYPVRAAPAGTLLAMLVLLAVPSLPILACQGAARDGYCSAGAEKSGAEPLPSAVPRDSAGVPLVPILSRYEVLAVYDVLPVGSDRADYSGITVVGADSSMVTLWLAADKALRLEDAIYAIRLDLPNGPRAQVTSLEPARIKVENEHGLPTGADIEDIGWLPPTATAPGLLAASGERGPGDAPVSWFYLLVPEGQGLRLSRSGNASPPGESVENDGMEGVALRRAAGDRVELYLFKERPAPSYARLFVLEPDGFGYRLVPGSSSVIFSTPAFQTQSGAAFRPGGKTVSVIDRPAAPDRNGAALPRPSGTRIDTAGVDQLCGHRLTPRGTGLGYVPLSLRGSGRNSGGHVRAALSPGRQQRGPPLEARGSEKHEAVTTTEDKVARARRTMAVPQCSFLFLR